MRMTCSYWTEGAISTINKSGAMTMTDDPMETNGAKGRSQHEAVQQDDGAVCWRHLKKDIERWEFYCSEVDLLVCWCVADI